MERIEARPVERLVALVARIHKEVVRDFRDWDAGPNPALTRRTVEGRPTLL